LEKDRKREKKLSKSEKFTDGDCLEINSVDPFSERRVLCLEINSVDPFSERRVLQKITLEDSDIAFQALQYHESLDSSFPNTNNLQDYALC
jgi:hypothetical protein